jgi:hypothetical protein
MYSDPIVDEVHRVRAELLAGCGGDLEKLMARHVAQEAQHRDRLVGPEVLRKRREAEAARASTDAGGNTA